MEGNTTTMIDFGNSDESYFGGRLAVPQSNDGIDFEMSNNFPIMDSNMDPFAQNQGYLGQNEDLNSFFTPGLTVFDKVMPHGQWDNGACSQLFGQKDGFPFPFQPTPTQHQIPTASFPLMNTTWPKPKFEATSIEQPTSVIAEEQLDKPEEIEKPKRGRPRKRKRKDPLSEAEQQRKREAFLERNRRAASKCRKRKKESTESIQHRAHQLEKESQFLGAELMLAREEHARWLAMAIEHSKACPDNSLFQEHLREADERLANPLIQSIMAKRVDWADYDSNAIARSSRSGSSCPSSTDNDQRPFDQSEDQSNNQLQEEDLMMSREQTVPHDNTIVSPTDLQVDKSMARRFSTHSLAFSQDSSAMTRKNSNSSNNDESAHSSCTSFEPTPDSEMFNGDIDRPMMLANQRIANVTGKPIAPTVEKRLRSGKKIV